MYDSLASRDFQWLLQFLHFRFLKPTTGFKS